MHSAISFDHFDMNFNLHTRTQAHMHLLSVTGSAPPRLRRRGTTIKNLISVFINSLKLWTTLAFWCCCCLLSLQKTRLLFATVTLMRAYTHAHTYTHTQINRHCLQILTHVFLSVEICDTSTLCGIRSFWIWYIQLRLSVLEGSRHRTQVRYYRKGNRCSGAVCNRMKSCNMKKYIMLSCTYTVHAGRHVHLSGCETCPWRDGWWPGWSGIFGVYFESPNTRS